MYDFLYMFLFPAYVHMHTHMHTDSFKAPIGLIRLPCHSCSLDSGFPGFYMHGN